MLMDGETGDENGEVKIEAGETGEAERDAQQAKSFHARISDAACDCHEGFAVDRINRIYWIEWALIL